MKNLRTKKLYLQVYDELKKYIARETMKPGDKLPTEMELSEKLGVSRNVLREAIKALEIIGVISSKPGVGMVLNNFNSNFLSSCLFLNLIGDGIDIVEQSQEVRKAIEIGFSEKCFNSITPEQIKKLESYLDEMKKEEDVVDFYEIDSQFHKTMYENVHNEVLLAFIDSAWAYEKCYRTRWHSNHKLTYEKHRRIVRALQEHDYDTFMDALHYHFEYSFKTQRIPTKSTTLDANVEEYGSRVNDE